MGKTMAWGWVLGLMLAGSFPVQAQDSSPPTVEAGTRDSWLFSRSLGARANWADRTDSASLLPVGRIAANDFNAWRYTLRFAFLNGTDTRFALGLTARTRDPDTLLFSRFATQSTRSSLPQAVPLLHAYGEQRLWGRWRLSGDLDTLSNGRGRGYDLGLHMTFDFSKAWSATAGYRLSDGGDEPDALPRSNAFSLGTRLAF